MASITCTVPDAKLAEFKVGFLSAHPVPLKRDSSGKTTPSMTVDEWIKEWVRQQLTKAYREGKTKIAHQEAASAPGDIIQ